MHKSIIIKPTHSCNLSCEYCYLDENAENGFMTSETLQNSLEKVVRAFGKGTPVEYIWHGGEPLIRGLDFFREITEIVDFLRKEGYSISNCIQSNGTLLTEEMADYFSNREHYFGIGFSLDGPKEIHDLTRHYRNGNGSFEEVIKGINIAKKYFGHVGAIAVMSKKNIGHIKEMYEFFKENDITLKANPLIHSGSAIGKEYLGITPVEYGRAMINLFDIWFNDENPNMKMTVDNMDALVRTRLTGNAYSCNHSRSCNDKFLSIGPLGDVYPCGRFDGNETFNLGNINTDSVETILEKAKASSFSSRTKMLSSCGKCEYGKVCNGGCMHNGYMRKENIFDKDYYCKSYKMMFGHIFDEVKKELEIAKIE